MEAIVICRLAGTTVVEPTSPTIKIELYNHLFAPIQWFREDITRIRSNNEVR